MGDVTEDPVGGRVLVVAPSDSSGGAADYDSHVHGDDASGTDSDGSRSASGGDPPGADGGRSAPSNDGYSVPDVDPDSRTDGEPNGPPGAPSTAGDDVGSDPETVAAGLDDRLPAEVVLRDERTAGEYLAELGPTIDCVVTLGGDTGPLGALSDGVSIPAIVCERPIVEEETSESAPLTLDEVASRVRAVVREARGRNELRDQNIRLTALSRYARDITGCETVDAVLERTLEAATDALAFDYCVILMVDGDRLVPRASVLPDPELSPCGVTEGIAGRTLQAGEAEIVADMQSDPDALPEHDDLHAVLSVPIGSRGVLQVASHSCGVFDGRDKEFAEILSGYTREALARLEREMTLRAERDRLHAFYTAVPVPVLCVERRDGRITVADANRAYEEAFSGGTVGRPLSAAVPTGAERDRYEAALNGEGVSQEPIVRTAGNREEEFTLTVIPVSPPDGSEYAFGVYRADGLDLDSHGVE